MLQIIMIILGSICLSFAFVGTLIKIVDLVDALTRAAELTVDFTKETIYIALGISLLMISIVCL